MRANGRSVAARLLASAAVVPVAALALCLPWLALISAAVVAEAAGLHRLSAALATAALLVLVLTVVLNLVCVGPAARSIAPLQRRTARTLARHRHVTLIEANALAADRAQPRATTEQVLRLLRHADAKRLAILANPRNPAVAAMYRRLGFQPVAAGRGRLLVRWPTTLAGQ